MHVTDTDHPIVGGYALVNADTDEDIYTSPIYDLPFDYNDPNTPSNFNTRINTHPEEVGSVVFEHSFEDYNGNRTRTKRHTENVPPYALFGDIEGNYLGEPFEGGIYFIKATPYTKPKGKGKAGTPAEFYIDVYGAPNARVEGNIAVPKSESAERLPFEKSTTELEAASFTTFPNPFSHELNIRYVAKSTGILSVDVYNLQGSMIKRLYAGNIEANQPLSLVLSREGMPHGIYICKVQNADEVHTQRIVLNKY